MSSIVFGFLNAELTPIPQFLRGIFGANFNSALTNFITWLFLIWIILYVYYDKLINVLFKYLKFPQYLRSRLTNSIWDFSMHTCFLVSFRFYITKKYPYNSWDVLLFFEHQEDSVSLLDSVTFAGLCSCLLANACIQGVQRSFLCFVKFAALAICCSCAYIVGFPNMSFTLAALQAFPGMLEELTRLSFCGLNKSNKLGRAIIDLIFVDSLIVFCIVYLYAIPITCVVPVVLMWFPGNTGLVHLVLLISLLCWISLVIYTSPSVNSTFHQLCHRETASLPTDIENQSLPMRLKCLGTLTECALFPPRLDDGFVMAFLRSEEKKRKTQLNASRKPKNKNMIIQTLKCMLTIKKKLNQKLKRRRSEESAEASEPDSAQDSDSDDSSTSHESLTEVKTSTKMMELQAKSEEGSLPLEVKEEDFEAIESEIKSDNLDNPIGQDREDSEDLDELRKTENTEKLDDVTEEVKSLVDACELEEPESGRNKKTPKLEH
ncbi:uncharacterized protein LOC109539813 isoform X2 [Dendroctonus ponderosae]|uniref:uncharacterized protein LOC109539813 isoform X2 n=1 Tax=Dendroctonus ponderosae TaxID=77166 RepID=UPI0020353E62|nr:uncharacterized protein LOC109539813 isoform X2 [Dendroctonus ponderosae]XP_048524089.1 uncharacterized protein LOC109539813 isoform X2 [Dendroctonus ponderosae]XP_048524090.1 uncharacterized protein LOC109539813 isoform X2 [Dendroctonus ponderosae]